MFGLFIIRSLILWMRINCEQEIHIYFINCSDTQPVRTTSQEYENTIKLTLFSELAEIKSLIATNDVMSARVAIWRVEA